MRTIEYQVENTFLGRQEGDIALGFLVGIKSTSNYIYQKCPECKCLRWVPLFRSATSTLCKSCRDKSFKTTRLTNGNPIWKGDKVGYAQLHEWVRMRKPKPEYCEKCGKFMPYDMANKGIYNRDLINWEWLCRKCHMIKDGRLAQLTRRNRDGG